MTMLPRHSSHSRYDSILDLIVDLSERSSKGYGLLGYSLVDVDQK